MSGGAVGYPFQILGQDGLNSSQLRAKHSPCGPPRRSAEPAPWWEPGPGRSGTACGDYIFHSPADGMRAQR